MARTDQTKLAPNGKSSSRLSHAQRQIWTGQQLHPEVPVYNMALAFTIEGELDQQLFARAFAHVISSTDAMRTVFAVSGDQVERTVLSEIESDLQVVHCDPADQGADAARSFMEEATRKPFDVTTKCFASALLSFGPERHIWFLNQHHLIADAWSFTVTYQRVIRAYNTLEATGALPVDVEVDYQALVDHEIEHAASSTRHAAIDYWDNLAIPRANLYGRSGSLDSTASTRESRKLGPSRTALLHDLIAQPGIRSLSRDLSVFNVLAAVLSAWIARTSGQREVGLGFFGHNRATRELKDVAGTFVELFPLVNEVDSADSFAALIKRTATQSMQSLKRVGINVSQPRFTRDINVVFNMINATLPEFGARHVRTEWIHNGHCESSHDVRAQFYDLDGTGDLTAVFDFKDSVFDPEQRAFALEHFLQLLDACLETPDGSVAAVTLAGVDEQQMLGQLSETAPVSAQTSTPLAVPPFRRIEQAAADHPDRVACWANGETLTYAQLDLAANALAHTLSKFEGSNRGVVAVSVGRSLDFVVAALAAQKAGAAYLPIDPSDPLDRRLGLISNSGACAVVVDRDVAVEGRIKVDQLSVDLGSVRATPPDVDVTPSHVAYVIGTSGSTGMPKLIQVEHKNLSALLAGLDEHIYTKHLTPDSAPSNVAVVSPFGFDLSVGQIFAALTLGHTVHIVPHEVRSDGALLLDFLRHHEIAVSDGTPAHLRMLLDAAPPGALDLDTHLLIAGDVLPKAVAQRFLERSTNSSSTLTNLYGPAECTIYSTLYPVTSDQLANYPTVPIGRPLPGVRVSVVDDLGNRQPFGVAGELCIAGSVVGRGYLGNQDLTSQKFGDDAEHAGERMYKTGDLARMSSNGVIEFVGRFDSMVKVQGYRIEVPEIERALKSYASKRRGSETGDDVRQVSDAAVKVVEDDSGARQLHAFYVANQPLTVDELRSALGQTLPHYMIPVRFSQVDEIPLTKNGKVDRNALQTSAERPQLAAPFAAPTTAAEVTMASIWRDILGVDEIGIRDNFFAIGGDSIMALELVARANEAGLRISPMQIFMAPTIAALVDVAESTPVTDTAIDPDQVAPPTRRLTDGDVPPMTVAEQSLLVDQSLRPDAKMFNLAAIYTVDGPLDAERFKDAAQQAVQYHEPLQWTYESSRRRLTPEQAVLCQIEPVRPAGPEVDDIVDRIQMQSYDLRTGPLLRVLIQPLTNGDTLVSLNMHHIACDHGSFDILWQAIAAIYSGDQPSTPLISVADVEHWQADRWDRDQQFWSERAFGAVFSTGADSDEQDGYVEIASALPGSELRSAAGRSVFSVVLAGAVAAVRPLHRSNDVEVCLVASTRNHELARPLVGYLLNPLPLQFSANSDRTLDDLVNEVSTVTARALTHRTYPYARMVEDARGQQRSVPGGQVFVAISDEPPLEIDGAAVEQRVRFNGSSVTDLTLFVQLRGESVTFGAEYNGRVGQASANMVLALFEESITAVLRAPHTAVGDIEVANDHSSLLVGNPLGLERLVLDGVLDHVATGETWRNAIAVEVGGEQLRWGDLLDRASLVAEVLREQGVTPGDRVVVRTERSVHVPVALLGVLLAGASYAPMSVSLPAERVLENAASVGSSLEIITGAVDAVLESSLVLHDSSFDGKAWSAVFDPAVELPQAHDEAYVIFTSGSTGRANPVAITHGQIAASTNARSQVYDDRPTKFAVLSGLGFDSSLVGLIWALSTGGTVVLPTEDQSIDIDALAELLATSDLSHALCVPTLYGLLLNRRTHAGWPAHMIVAGEACTASLVAAHFDSVPESLLTNEYGPTEASIWATSHRCKPATGHPPIGAPIPGVWVAVVDQADRVMPAGVPGELVIGGPTVAIGYVTDPNHSRFGGGAEIEGLTDKRCSATDRIFRTGDRATIRDGVVHFLGRNDEQINIGGVRVEPGEIEAALTSFAGIEAAAVVAVDVRTTDEMISQVPPSELAHTLTQAASASDPAQALRSALSSFGDADMRLVAHLATSQDLDLGEVRKHMATVTDPLRQPKMYGLHEDLPRTTNGKVDRKAAALLPIESQSQAVAVELADTSGWQARIQALFSHVLRSSAVGPDESFFDLGGDSLQALKLLNLLEERHGVHLPAASVHNAPTVQLLAGRVEKLSGGAATTSTPATAATLEELVDDDELVAVALQAHGSQVPIFALHVIGPGGDGWLKMVRELGDEYPFYCLADVRAVVNPWQEDDVLEPRSIEAAAARYARAIRNVVPTGPVNLIGLCQGGLLAFETAQQLDRLGGEVDHVVIVHDAHAPDGEAFPGLIASFKSAKHISGQTWAPYLVGMFRRGLYLRNVRYYTSSALLRVATSLRIPAVGPLRKIAQTETVIDDLKGYQFNHYDGRLRVVRGTSSSQGTLNGDWSSYVADLDVRSVPGDGWGLLEDHIKGTAEVVKEWIWVDGRGNGKPAAVDLVSAVHNRSIDFHLPRLLADAPSAESREKLERIDAMTRTFADGVRSEADRLLTLAGDAGASIQLAPVADRIVAAHAALVAKTGSEDSLQSVLHDQGYKRQQFATGHADVFVHPDTPWRFAVVVADAESAATSHNAKDAGELGGLLGTPVGLIGPLLEFGDARSGERIVDLGCGDARVLIEAAKRFGMTGHGIESDPQVFELAVNNVRRAGLADKIQISLGDAMTADIEDADLVFAFVPPEAASVLIGQTVPRLASSGRLIVHEVLEVSYPVDPDQVEVLVSEADVGVNDMGLTVAARWTAPVTHNAVPR